MRFPRTLIVCIMLGLAVGLPACKPPAAAPSAELAAYKARTDSPEAAARSLLEGLQIAQHMAFAGDHEGYRDALERTCTVAARTPIIRRARAARAVDPRWSEDEIVGSLVKNWGQALGLYLDDLDLDQLAAIGAPSAQRATLMVALKPGKGPTRVRIECLRSGDAWGVDRVEFVPPGEARPAPATATAPSAGDAPATAPAAP